MKTTTLVAALALLAAGAASAQEATYELPQAAVSKTTRAAVVADLQQARAAGLIVDGERSATTPFVAQRSRADVRAETLAAAATGELRAATAEPSSFDGRFVAPQATGRVFAAVR